MSDKEMIPQGSSGASGSGSKGSNTGVKIALIIICFPFIIAAAATLFGLTVGAFGLVFGLMAGLCGIIVGFIAAGIVAVFSLFFHIIAGHTAIGILNAGVGLVLAGLGILFIPAMKSVVVFSIGLIKKMFGLIKRLFTRRTA